MFTHKLDPEGSTMFRKNLWSFTLSVPCALAFVLVCTAMAATPAQSAANEDDQLQACLVNVIRLSAVYVPNLPALVGQGDQRTPPCGPLFDASALSQSPAILRTRAPRRAIR